MRVLIFLFFLSLIFSLFSSYLSNIDPNFYLYDAKAISMANAYTALSDHTSSVIWNPAGLNGLSRQNNVIFSNSNLQNLLPYNFFGYGYKLSKLVSLGSGITYNGEPALSELTFDVSVAVNGKIFDKYIARFSHITNRIDFGLSLKYIGSFFGNNTDGSYDDDGSEHRVSGSSAGFGIDLGLQAQLTEDQRFGLMFRNNVNNILYHSYNEVGTAQGTYWESIPSTLILGYTFRKGQFTFSSDYDISLHNDTYDIFKTGIELYAIKDLFALRSGYSQETASGENKKLSLGTGFKLPIWNDTQIEVDFAYQILYEWTGHNLICFSIGIMR